MPKEYPLFELAKKNFREQMFALSPTFPTVNELESLQALTDDDDAKFIINNFRVAEFSNGHKLVVWNGSPFSRRPYSYRQYGLSAQGEMLKVVNQRLDGTYAEIWTEVAQETMMAHDDYLYIDPELIEILTQTYQAARIRLGFQTQ